MNAWRKIMITAAAGACMILLAAGCTDSKRELEPSPGVILEVAKASGPSDEGFAAQRMIDNSGMSGTAGRRQWHTSGNKTEWRWTAAGQEKEIQLQFDLGEVVPLGEMWIWNRNVRKVRIDISVDQEHWKEWKGEGYPYELAPARENGQASNLNNEQHTPIVFNGTNVRYVRLTIQNVPGEGNWEEETGAGDEFGLGEVRFYRYALKVVSGEMIVPASAMVDGEDYDSQGPEHAANNFGMEGFGTGERHGNNPNTMWLATTTSAKPHSLTMDLGGTYPLKEMRIWNYNEKDREANGLKNVSIYYSVDRLVWEEVKGPGYPYVLAKADGSDSLKATNLDDGEHSPVDLTGISARYVKIVPALEMEKRSWGGAEGMYGLSEVRVYADKGLAVEPAPDWEAMFSHYSGWSGADGIFSIPLNGVDKPGTAGDTNTMFLFSDTFVGEVDPLSHQRMQASMLHNSFSLLEGGEPDPAHMTFTYLPNSADVHLFTPKTKESLKGSWYWLQDGVAIGDTVYIFPVVVIPSSGTPGFNFAIYDVNMLKVPLTKGKPDPDRYEQLDTPLFAKLPDGSGNIVYGAGILNNTEEAGVPNPDGYIYVYGYIDITYGNKQLIAARVKPEHIESFDQWRYWNGSEWSPNILESSPLIEGVSTELSVTPMTEGPYKGKYLLVVERDVLSGYVAISAGDSPAGPFSPLEKVYYTPEIDRGEQIFTYNAKAHPHLSKPGELLISYNVNSTGPLTNNMNGDVYRPRWVKLRTIGEE